MSDFDKEAERERLREQYERDKQEREAAEQMSELLLQGATMTNAHCSECGDPIFRYDNQEFCPTCERPVSRSDDGRATTGDETDTTSATDETIEVTTPSDDARVAFGGVDGSDSPTAADQTGTGASTDARADAETNGSPAPDDNRDPGPDRGHDQSQPRDQNRRQETTDASAATRSRPQSSASATASTATAPDTATATATARESLTEALVRFSEQAAATDDPRRAQDALAAAREAAEALAALRY